MQREELGKVAESERHRTERPAREHADTIRRLSQRAKPEREAIVRALGEGIEKNEVNTR